MKYFYNICFCYVYISKPLIKANSPPINLILDENCAYINKITAIIKNL